MEKMSLFGSNIEEHLFYLMNKDECLLQFSVDIVGPTECIVIKEKFKVLPYWIKNPVIFIENRRAPKQRENIERLLKESGCDTILIYLSITHALSLVDTYWVKPVGSNLKWDNVSLYTHKFNEVVAKTAFEGGLHGRDLLTTSPEYGTDGTFAKCWIRDDGQIKLLKRGSSGARNAGLEPFSEFYISQIAAALGLDAVMYDLRNSDKGICSVCDIFTSEECGYLPYTVAEKEEDNSLLSVIDFYANLGFEEWIRDMFVFDAIVFNEDRHKSNFGVLVDNQSGKIIKPAPLFDHNIALLCYAEEDDFNQLDKYLEFKRPRLGNDFIKEARWLLTPSMKRKLINLKGFKFQKHLKYNLPDWRLDALSSAVNRQINLILEK